MKTITFGFTGLLLVIAFSPAVHADIGVRGRSDGGLYLSPGDWENGPWPETGALFQLIWSPSLPVITDLTMSEGESGKAGEIILFSGSTGSYGYVTPTPLIVVPGDVNSGYIIMRIYSDDSPDIGDQMYESVAPTAPPLPGYEPGNPSTIFDHFATRPDEPQVMNVTALFIPEPAAAPLFILGAAILARRRRL